MKNKTGIEVLADWTLIFVVVVLLGGIFHVVLNSGLDQMNEMPIKNLEYQMKLDGGK